MKKSEFVFGVMTYNQESIICETLESIKYQIETYGKDVDCTIIVTDDCSKDKTVEVVENWLQNNEKLFCNIIKKYNKENKGVPYNYNAIMQLIKTEAFEIVAGDDLLSTENIFETAKKLYSNELLCTLPTYLIGNKIVVNRSKLERQFWLMNIRLTKTQCQRLFKMSMLIHSPSAVYSKYLYNEGRCWELNSQFRLFEDDPSWYSMFKNVSDMKVQISGDIQVLYRISEKSISNRKVNDAAKKAFEDELHKLYKIYINDGNCLDRLYFGLKLNVFTHKLRLDRILDKLVHLRFWFFCRTHSFRFRQYSNKVYQEVEKQQRFYDAIKCKINEDA